MTAHITQFPENPVGWHYCCRSDRIRRQAVRTELCGRAYVTFRDSAGRAVTLDARCSHMRADLSLGFVSGGRIRCPLHGWEYAGDGKCSHIPASKQIPPFACQATYPTVELGGHVLFCNAPVAPFGMPFFDGRSPEELVAAPPFELIGEVPWYLIGANGFDFQHFHVAHDRRLIDTPVIDSPSPYARRIAATYEVTGNSPRDQLTRRIAGPRVRMIVTSWSGTNIIVTAEFKRTTTYGMVFVSPLPGDRSRLVVLVWVDRRLRAIARAVINPLDAVIRSWFIRKFLTEDTGPTAGVRYNPATLIDADRPLREYMDWLIAASNGPATGISEAKVDWDVAKAGGL